MLDKFIMVVGTEGDRYFCNPMQIMSVDFIPKSADKYFVTFMNGVLVPISEKQYLDLCSQLSRKD